MSRKMQMACPNCGKNNVVVEDELVSGISTRDINGNIIDEFPPVVIDDRTLVACSHCRYPMSAKDAKVL